ncbi:hypothetical protein Ancab_002840 [Ancistrocladus abbreviatus]
MKSLPVKINGQTLFLRVSEETEGGKSVQAHGRRGRSEGKKWAEIDESPEVESDDPLSPAWISESTEAVEKGSPAMKLVSAMNIMMVSDAEQEEIQNSKENCGIQHGVRNSRSVEKSETDGTKMQSMIRRRGGVELSENDIHLDRNGLHKWAKVNSALSAREHENRNKKLVRTRGKNRPNTLYCKAFTKLTNRRAKTIDGENEERGSEKDRTQRRKKSGSTIEKCRTQSEEKGADRGSGSSCCQ